ncbi:CapA family protein [Acidobacteria bacterium AH-259-O06]|nr:CapA family protein [Acidobacteria bacterium AH-259-O06]
MRYPAVLIGLTPVWLFMAGPMGHAGAPQTSPPEPVASPSLRVVLVGQALIRKDLRPFAPESVEQARGYLGGADVAFTNLEVAVAPKGAPVKPRSETVIPVSPAVLDCLKDMGFNMLSLANNHAWDLRAEGVLTTIAEVDKRGFARAGTGANADAAAAAGYLDTSAGKVALVAMASGAGQLKPETWAGPDRTGVNFLELRQDGTLNPDQKDRILRAVREAARRARFVIAYQHNHYWGERRGVDGPPGRERRIDRFDTPAWMEGWARQLIDAGASIYVAHGNPALHGVEIYKGRLILYGLGNFIFQSRGSVDRYGPLAWYSAVVDCEFVDGRVAAVRFKPLALAMDGEGRGAPYLAQGGEAAAILGRLADISRRHGTQIRVEGESAEVVLR